ncbi:MAG: glycosyltransferase family 2 protein [Byssovorax sp.]
MLGRALAMGSCAIIPAYDAERTVGEVVRAVRAAWPEGGIVLVVDDGSTDRTAEAAREAGAVVLVHPRNQGKGAALRTGLREALRLGATLAVSVDADGQHRAEDARLLLDAPGDPRALVLGVRDLVAAGAPRPNQISNRISNFFLSLFAGRPFLDTQCGLRRYPVAATLGLDARDDGYAFEAEVILRAVAARLPIVEVPITAIYPPESERVTHFDAVRDPARIVSRVVRTLVSTRGLRRAPASIDAFTTRSPSSRPPRPA